MYLIKLNLTSHYVLMDTTRVHHSNGFRLAISTVDRKGEYVVSLNECKAVSTVSEKRMEESSLNHCLQEEARLLCVEI